MKKKLLAILLALGLVITCMPMMAAFAATEIEENPLKFEKKEKTLIRLHLLCHRLTWRVALLQFS